MEVAIVGITSFMLPLGLFMFLRKLLDKENYLSLVIIGLSLIALIGVLLTIINMERNAFYLMLVIPISSILIYRGMYLLFIWEFKRPPVDTSLNWDDGLFIDRVFNIAYGIFGIVFPWIGALELIDYINQF